MAFSITKVNGCIIGTPHVKVYNAKGELKTCVPSGPPPAPVVWGTITGLVTNQTDLINYLGLNFYPLSSNPAGYLTQTAADARYYPLTSNPAGFITAAALAGYVPNTRTLTINGTSYDLSADRSWTIPAGGTVTSVELAAGTGISLSGTNPITVSGIITVTNSAPDQIVSIAGGTGISTSGTYPSFTVTNTLPDQTVVLTAGTGIGIAGTYPSFTISNTDPTSGVSLTSAGGTETLVNDGTGPSLATKGLSASTGISLSSTGTAVTITNSAPDQTVSLGTTGTGLSVTGTYPSFTLQNTLPDQTVALSAGTGISIAGTYPSFTITNTGLLAAPDLQTVLIAGSTLTQDNTIDGGGFTQIFDNNYKFGIYSEQLIALNVNDGTQSVQFNLYPQSNNTNWRYDDGGGNLTEIEMTGSKMYIRTPGYASATNGDVLTLVSNTSGEVEFQTPTGGGGGLLYGVASGTNTYAVTISGVTGYVNGDAYIIKFTNGNDADSTININGLGAKTLVKQFDIQVTGGDIVSGQQFIIMYDGTNFQTLGVAPNQFFAYVTNDDSVTINKGQPVYAFGAAGNRMSVKLAANTSDATSAQTVGLVFSTSIAPNQRGFVITQGVLSGVNTGAYSSGDQLYLGATAGTLTATKPFAPNHLVYIGIVERANAGNGQIYVKPQNGYEMNEIHDVQSNGAVNNDILYRDTTVTPNLWKPASISTILGYTPVPSTRTLTINGTGYDLSADRSWTVTAAVGDLPEISVSTANAREDNYAPTGWPGTTGIVKVIRINSTNTNYMMSLGGLASPSAGRIVTIYNASTANNLIIIENLSTSSTAANRFRMTANLSYFLLPNRSVTFIYDGTYWTQMSASNIGGLDIFDDMTAGGGAFATGGSTGLYGLLGSGTGAGVRPDTVLNDGFGEVSLSTGSTATGFAVISAQMRRNGATTSFGGNSATNSIPYLAVGRIYIPTLATGAQDYRIHIGMNGTSSLPTNAPGVGYLWVYQGSTSTFWDVASSNVSTTTTVTTSLAVTAGSWYWLGVYKPGGANIRDAVYFYSTNGVVYTMASKFVGTTGVYGGSPTLVIGSTVGTTAKALYCDWMGSSFNWTR